MNEDGRMVDVQAQGQVEMYRDSHCNFQISLHNPQARTSAARRSQQSTHMSALGKALRGRNRPCLELCSVNLYRPCADLCQVDLGAV